MARQKNGAAAQADDGAKPVHVIRLGRVRASIWANQNEHGVFYSVKVTRSFKDGDAWRNTDSFGRDDLLVAAKALDMAHTWICERMQSVPGEAQG